VAYELRQIAIIGQEQQSLGLKIEAANGEKTPPNLWWQQVVHGGTAFGVRFRGHIPRRLVEQHVAVATGLLNPLTIHLDEVGAQIDLLSDLRDLAVDRHTPLPDQLLGGAA